MDDVIPIYKWKGETPLVCIKRFQEAFPEYQNVPMTYAGRLDPMAHGLLVLLSGEKCKEKENYLGLNKTYYVDFVLGIVTDTYDVLGVVNRTMTINENSILQIQKILPTFMGKQNQIYPPYSSKTVDGKPLFIYAKEGKLDTITIPNHKIEIHEIEMVGNDVIAQTELVHKAVEMIAHIQGDFRQTESINSWQNLIPEALPQDGQKDRELPIISMKIRASSGTYVRQLVQDIAQKIGTCAVVTDIFRSEIGEFSLKYKGRRGIDMSI